MERVAGAFRRFTLAVCSTAPGLPYKMIQKLPFITSLLKSVIFDNVSFLVTVFIFMCAIGTSDTSAIFFTLMFGMVVVWNHFPRPDMATENEVLAPGQIVLIGQGGAGRLAPENTLASISKARSVGAKGVLVDLSFTQDDKPVLMKVDDISYTTNGRGRLSSMLLEEVKSLDAADSFPTPEFKGEKVPTLEEAIFECMRDDTRLYVCVNKCYQSDKAAMMLKRVFKKYQLYRSAAVCSYFPNVLYKVREADNRIVCCTMYHPHVLSRLADGSLRHKELWKQWLALLFDPLVEWLYYSIFWYLCGASIAFVHKSEVSRTLIEFWESKGIRIVVFGVENGTELKYFGNCLKISCVTDYFEQQESQTAIKSGMLS